MNPNILNITDMQELYRTMPKYKEIQQMLFAPTNNYFESYTDNLQLNSIVSVLGHIYSYLCSKHLTLAHSKWSYATVTDNIGRFHTFKEIINYNYDNPGNDYPTIHVLQITKGISIFDIVKEHPGYMREASIALQTDQNHKIAVVKHTVNRIIIVTNMCDANFMNTVMSLVPIVYPDAKLSPDVVNMFLAMASQDNDTIYDNLQKYFDTYDIATLKFIQVEKMLKKYINNDSNIKKISQSIASKERNMQDYFSSINNIMAEIKRMEFQKLGALENGPDKQIAELLEFLKSNKYIEITMVNNYNLGMVIETPIYFIDEVALKKYLDTKRSYLHESHTLIPKLLEETFIDKKYTITTRAKFNINLNYLNDSITGLNMYNITDIAQGRLQNNVDFDNKNSIPQPHLSYYECLGNNKTYLTQALKNNDIIGFVAQLIAACQNINIVDSSPCTKLIIDISATFKNNKCIMNNETKELLSFTDYIKIKAEEERLAKLAEIERLKALEAEKEVPVIKHKRIRTKKVVEPEPEPVQIEAEDIF